MMMTVRNHLHARSAALLLSIENGLPWIMRLWVTMALAASLVRIAVTPSRGTGPELSTFLPYLLVAAAPVVSMVLALRWFRAADRLPQPAVRLARLGSWTPLGRHDACRHPLYGTTGFIVPLMIGMLVNVPLRTAEYLAAMPALSGTVPPWLHWLQMMMTIDLVLMSSLYSVAFVAALRRLPHFPRLLALVWLVDLSLQAGMGAAAASFGALPPAVSLAFDNLLATNVLKATISVGIWLPYLLLSKRVNVTFRHRVPK